MTGYSIRRSGLGNEFEISYYYVGREYRELIDRVFAVAYGYLGQRGELSLEISFAGRKKIREINASTRGIDKVTDVLSFQYMRGIKGRVAADAVVDNDLYLGEIMICKSAAYKQAAEYGHSFEREIAFLAVHGLLHLMGYDHIADEEREEMERLQREILSSAGVER